MAIFELRSYKIPFLLISCLLSITMSFAATSGPAYEVKDFDVSGVKLGMSIDQAIDAVVRKYELKKNQIITFEQSSNAILKSKRNDVNFNKIVLNTTSEIPDEITKRVERNGFSIELNSNSRLVVQLKARIPPDAANPMTVVRVFYTMSDTVENKKMMSAAALEKYGVPSDQPVPSSQLYYWCSIPAIYGTGCIQSQKGSELLFAGSSLTLLDAGYSERKAVYLNQFKNTKPAF